MPITAAELVAKVSTTGVEESAAKMGFMGEVVDNAQNKFKALAVNLPLLAGAAVLAFAGMSVKMAGDFQAGMTSLVTGAGESEKNLKMVSSGILDMAVQTGTSTKQLTDGMYMIESAGFHGKAGLDVLRAAAMGAKVGAADLGTVANGVTTIMVDYAKQHVTAAQATNILVATVAAGKTHMADLAASMAMILPTASAVGVNIKDVAGAMATMTAEGTPAADAATYLRQLLMALEAPASKASKTLAEVGLSASDVASEMKKSLPGALQMITDHLKTKFPEGSAAYVDALKNIAGGSKQMQGILELTGTHLKTFKDNVVGIADAAKKGGTSITGWSLVQQDFNFKMSQAKEVVETFMIRLGTALLPVLGQVASFFVGTLVPAIARFGDWISKNVVPVLVQFGNWFLKNGMPVLLQFVNVLKQNVFPVLLTIVQIVGQVLGWIKDHWTQIWGALAPILKAAWDLITGVIKVAWSIVSGILSIALDILKGDWGKAWTDLKNMLAGIWDGIKQVLKAAWDYITALFHAAWVVVTLIWEPIGRWFGDRWNDIKNIFGGIGKWFGDLFQGAWNVITGIWNAIGTWFHDHVVAPIEAAWQALINWFKGNPANATTVHTDVTTGGTYTGGYAAPYAHAHATGTSYAPGGLSLLGERGPEMVLGPSLGWLARGSQVIPMSQMGGGYSGPSTIVLQVDGYQFARILMPHIANNIRIGVGTHGQ